MLLVKFFSFVNTFKYLLTFLAFIAWMLFFDRNNITYQWQMMKEIRNLESEKIFYEENIQKHRCLMHGISSNADTLEMVARESYLMKKDDEELFVLVDENLYKTP